MTRIRLNWAAQISVLACAVACGSSGNNSLGASNSKIASVGGTGATNGGAGNTAGVSNNNGGTNANAGNGSSDSGSSGASSQAGTGTSGANSQAGNSSGTGSSGSTTDGGSTNGGDGNIGGDNGSIGGDGPGGGSSIDVLTTGGGGNTQDTATGGGNTQDTATGGGFTVDTATGGGNTVDTATGGGNTVDTATGGGNTVDTATGGGNTIDQGTGGGTSVDFGCKNTTLSDVNVYVIKDATPSGADTEGNMYVGGNLTPTVGGYSIGACNVGAAAHKCAVTITCSEYALVVGGNVSDVNVYGGLAAAGGTVSDSSDSCGGIVRANPASLVPPVDFAALAANVESLSIKLSQLPATGTETFSNGTMTLTCPANQQQAVFDISGSDFSNANVITIDNSCASSILIVNVSGTTITKSGGGWTLPNNGALCSTNLNTFCEQVVWNMYQATSVTMSGFGLQGSLLAPLATLGGDGGDIDGQVIVEYLTGGLEYHPFYFSGCITWASAS